VASLFVHLGMWGGLTKAARLSPRERRSAIQFAVVEKQAPPPAAPKPAEPTPPKRKSPPPPVDVPVIKAPMPDLPPPPNTSASDAVPAQQAKPVFGISMSSVVGPGSGSGFAVRVGNTLMKAPEESYTPPSEVKSYRPVPLHVVNKMPSSKGGPCRADNRQYPPQAKELGIEGSVKLLMEIRSDGSLGEITVVDGLGYGLDEAAIRIVRNCHWNPAYVGDEPVTTKINYSVLFIVED